MQEYKPLVSVVMPVYNSEKYIEEAIESVISQSYKKWELVIVDDGSTDYTPVILDTYAYNDSRIKVFHKENEGVSLARNFALNKICGEYVTFIDSDDVYHTDRIKNMIRIFKQSIDCDAVFSRFKEFKGELEVNESIGSGKIKIIDEKILEKVISDTNKHFMCNIMIKSEIAKIIKFESIRFAEDFCYIRDCALHCNKIAVLDEVLYYYRRDNNNAMTSHFFSEKYITDFMKIVESTYDFCNSHKLNNAFYKKMVAHEYAQNCMRIRKSTSYKKFVSYMNDEKFREGISFADAFQCTLFEKILFNLVKYKIYLPFIFWVW